MNSPARLIAACGLLFAMTAAPTAAADDRDRRANEMVCVPAADGRTWACGTRANPPPESGVAPAPLRGASSAPPPFLAAPGAQATPLAPPRASAPRPARDAFPPAPQRDKDASAAEVTAAPETARAEVTPLAEAATAPVEPSTTADAVAAPAIVQPAARAAASAPPPMLAAPRQRLAPYAPVGTPAAAEAASAPAPVASSAPSVQPTPARERAPEARADPSPEPASDPAPAPPVTVDAASSDASAAPPGDRDDFLALAANRATLQLARAARRGELYTTWQRLLADSGGALTSGTAYIVTLDAGGAPQALLLWSDFADAAAARAAWDALPGFPAGKPAAYARRIAPLQDEVRRSDSTR